MQLEFAADLNRDKYDNYFSNFSERERLVTSRVAKEPIEREIIQSLDLTYATVTDNLKDPKNFKIASHIVAMEGFHRFKNVLNVDNEFLALPYLMMRCLNRHLISFEIAGELSFPDQISCGDFKKMGVTERKVILF